MGRALFSATKKNQAARQTAKRRKAGRSGRSLKIGTIHSHAARREAAKEQRLERRRAAEGVAMPAENWPRVPKRPTPTSGPVFPAVLPGSAFIDKQGNVRSWLYLQISWVMRQGAVYWVVVPHMFYPWSMTEEDKEEHRAAMRWFYRLSHCSDSPLPDARQPVMLEGWAIDGEAAVEAATEAITGLPQHVAALPINVPPTPRIRAHAARASLNSLPSSQQRPPAHMAQQATEALRARRSEVQELKAQESKEPVFNAVGPRFSLEPNPVEPKAAKASQEPCLEMAQLTPPDRLATEPEIPRYLLRMGADEILKAFAAARLDA